VRLHNDTGAACDVSGWFTVRLDDAHGRALPSREQRITTDYFGTSPRRTVTVSSGGVASFAIDTVFPVSSCASPVSIAVGAPGGHGVDRLRLSVLACPRFAVLPVQPGDKAIFP
jgi:hypothetical protein